MKCLAAILFACLAVAAAQVPFRCKSPDAWEARTYQIRLSSSVTESYARSGRMFYDAPGQRVVFEEEYYNGDVETAAYNDYYFFKENYRLRYNTMTKQCFRYPLTGINFTRIEVPPTAQFLDTRIIGTNAAEKFGVAVNLWGDDGRNGRIILEFIADDGDGDEDCLPVGFTEFGAPGSTMGFRHEMYYDIVIGVNPDHFIPPTVCPR